MVLIEWVDSRQPVPEWRYVSDYDNAMNVIPVMSLGFLIHDGKDVKALAPNLGQIGQDDEQTSGVIRIPSRAVLKMKRLRTGR
ncbi:hypothetical protein [Ferrovibrio sp.]|uniref:hypothetical protein n=1 Tax=Ferrovibrio sp. TaxID=1917215 RepID=UPI0025B83BAE|nr:hypothetical protein [Ferrovibrio sp.]